MTQERTPSGAPLPEALEKTIHGCFEEQVTRSPEKVAVQGDTRSVSFEALNRAANRLGWAILGERGEGLEPVALYIDEEIDFLVGLLGALKARKFYIPVDPSFPEDRVADILADSQTRLILTNAERLERAKRLAKGGVRTLNLSEVDGGFPDRNPELAVSPSDYAALIYTSGSTGEPKGVAQDHRYRIHRSWYFREILRPLPDDRQAQLFSLSFDAAQSYILGALLNGVGSYSYDLQNKGLSQLTDWLIANEITMLFPGVALLREFGHLLESEVYFPKLRRVSMAGQTMYKQDIENFASHCSPECIFTNGFGSTEAGAVTDFTVNANTELGEGPVPLGRAIPGKTVLILDEARRELGPNEVGEIAIKSRYLASGYWRDEALTEKKFIPAGEGSEEGIFLTGDEGKLDEEGILTLLGRKDFMVKVRGFRVEMGEIETRLFEHPSIQDAAVVAVEKAGGEPQLVAHVVPREAREEVLDLRQILTVDDLRSFLGEKLPEYMIPHAFLFHHSLPLTATGKIDRKALPEPGGRRSESMGTLVRPRDETEIRLVNLWEEVLSIAPVGIHDQFFDLGGDSLSAMRLFAEIKKAMHIDLPIALFYEAATVAQQADLLREEGWSGKFTSLVALRAGGSQPPLFCVPGGEGVVLVFHNLAMALGEDQPVYGFQPVGLNGRRRPLSVMEEMAAYYIEEMTAVQAEGPYFLCGYSSGGVVALEMAQQLRAAGREIAMVVLLDTHYPRPQTGWLAQKRWEFGVNFPILRERVRKYKEHWRAMRGLGLKGKREYWAKRDDQIKFDPLDPLGWAAFRVKVAGEIALRNYRLKPYAGDVTYVKSTRRRKKGSSWRQASLDKWEDIVQGRFRVIEVPGDHRSMMKKDNASAWGDKLGEVLRGSN